MFISNKPHISILNMSQSPQPSPPGLVQTEAYADLLAQDLKFLVSTIHISLLPYHRKFHESDNKSDIIMPANVIDYFKELLQKAFSAEPHEFDNKSAEIHPPPNLYHCIKALLGMTEVDPKQIGTNPYYSLLDLLRRNHPLQVDLRDNPDVLLNLTECLFYPAFCDCASCCSLLGIVPYPVGRICTLCKADHTTPLQEVQLPFGMSRWIVCGSCAERLESTLDHTGWRRIYDLLLQASNTLPSTELSVFQLLTPKLAFNILQRISDCFQHMNVESKLRETLVVRKTDSVNAANVANVPERAKFNYPLTRKQWTTLYRILNQAEQPESNPKRRRLAPDDDESRSIISKGLLKSLWEVFDHIGSLGIHLSG